MAGTRKFSHFRAHPRHKKRIELSFPTDNRRVQAVTVDIGLGGVFIATDVLLPRGTAVEISFSLPQRAVPLVFSGVVRWLNDGTPQPDDADDRPTVRGMGIAFQDVAPDALIVLSEFLANEN
ncbi:MAG: PilZ domain-containing protein [Deltaproteobacteria bacterium]|nr:PilZ domain-containing protein [Deltaproteobacteria bacterium]